jgi:hypothetical protein
MRMIVFVVVCVIVCQQEVQINVKLAFERNKKKKIERERGHETWPELADCFLAAFGLGSTIILYLSF